MAAPSRWQRFSDALDERTGIRGIWKAFADEPVSGGARYAYAFGSGLVLTFLIQALTGIALASVYTPSTSDAWGSVHYIQHQMTMGALVRGVHHFGSSAMIVLCVLHLTQVFFWGAYRKPREANWLTGVVMLLLVLGFGLTGYLLPWDQKGYWATQVATSIIGGAPGGEPLQAILQGGEAYGNQTLTRFYALHVFVLPATLIVFLVAHLGFFRRHGVTPSQGLREATLRQSQPFWPYQMLKDTLIGLLVLAVLIALALSVGASLEAPADPSSAYEARPEWYYLFLFQLLKYFEGPMVVVGTIVIPTLGLVFLAAVPFLDRRPDGARARPSLKVAVPFLLLLGGVGALTFAAELEDRGNPTFLEGRASAEREAQRAHELAVLGGIDAAGRVTLFEGERLFGSKQCASCHAPDAKPTRGPLLGGYGRRERLERFLADPDHPDFFGGTVLADSMPAVELGEGPKRALVAYLGSLGPSLDAAAATAEELAQGAALFKSEGCTDCHNQPGVPPRDEGYDPKADGPDLDGYQGYEWTRGLILDASHARYFGDVIGEEAIRDAKVMPAYADLTPDELDLLVRWLLAGAPGAASSGRQSSKP
jgi:ubiquinol-cytochrome c reductase cytochrome b subunit